MGLCTSALDQAVARAHLMFAVCHRFCGGHRACELLMMQRPNTRNSARCCAARIFGMHAGHCDRAVRAPILRRRTSLLSYSACAWRVRPCCQLLFELNLKLSRDHRAQARRDMGRGIHFPRRRRSEPVGADRRIELAVVPCVRRRRVGHAMAARECRGTPSHRRYQRQPRAVHRAGRGPCCLGAFGAPQSPYLISLAFLPSCSR